MRRWMFIMVGWMAKGFPWARRLLISIMVALGGLALLSSAARAVDYHVGGNVDEGLVAYFKFDENSGTVTRSFPNTTIITATLQSGASFNTSLPPGFDGLNFATLNLTGNDGTNNVDILDNDTTGPFLNSLTGPLTVAAWARRYRLNGGLDSIYVSGSNADAWNFVITPDHRLAFRIGVGNPATTYSTTLASTAIISTTTWHHFAATFSGGTLKLYIDGQENITYNGITGSASLSGPKAIGSNIDDSGRFPGQLDELRLYNRALSQTEIQRIANIGCSRDGKSWPNAFVDLQCALAVDQSGDTVKVARNIFLPGTNRNASFHLDAGVQYLGNYDAATGNRVSFSQEAILNVGAAATTLDGDIAGNDFVLNGPVPNLANRDENIRHVVTAGCQGTIPLLDGFIIARGNADDDSTPSGTYGGGLVAVNDCRIDIANALFYENRADEGGAGASVDGNVHFDDVWFVNNRAALVGGGLYGLGTVNVEASRFETNSAGDGFGGAIGMNGTLTITNTDFLTNTAGLGGAIGYPDGGDLFVAGSRFQGNSATSLGGAIGSDNADLYVRDSEFTNNSAGDETGGGGGALYVESIGPSSNITGAMFITDTVFTGNAASVYGGAIRGRRLHMSGGSLSHNTAQRGGGLSIFGNGIATLTGVTVHANQAVTTTASVSTTSHFGGGIYLNGTLAMTDSTISENVALALRDPDCPVYDSGCSDASGGGLYVENGGEVTLAGVDFLDNRADDEGDDGGAIHMGQDGNLTYTNGLVEGNRSNYNAGISLEGADATISGVDFIRNIAFDDPGGGLGAFDSKLTFRDVAFIENRLIENDAGAGLYLGFDTQATLDRVLFQGNGQLAFLATDATTIVTATNLVMAGNHWATPPSPGDSSAADAISVSEASISVINSTLAGHTQDALPVANVSNGGRITFTNSILWDDPNVGTENGGTFALINTISGAPGSGTDPRFVRNPSSGDGNWATLGDNDYGDLRLRTDSPAIDAGDGSLLPAGVTLDFAGSPRIFDVAFTANAFSVPVDQGAYEADYVAPTANPGGPYANVQEGLPVTVDAGGSVDAAVVDVIASYEWDCTNDGTFDATGSTATCTYPEQGTFTLRLRVTDNDDLSNDAVTPVVVSNLPPNAVDDQVTTLIDTAVTIDVLANDSDVPADPLTIVSAGAPAHGTAALTADQRVRYTPVAGYVGADSFVYTVDDGDGGSDTASVQITVSLEGTQDGKRIFLPALQR